MRFWISADGTSKLVMQALGLVGSIEVLLAQRFSFEILDFCRWDEQTSDACNGAGGTPKKVQEQRFSNAVLQ